MWMNSSESIINPEVDWYDFRSSNSSKSVINPERNRGFRSSVDYVCLVHFADGSISLKPHEIPNHQHDPYLCVCASKQVTLAYPQDTCDPGQELNGTEVHGIRRSRFCNWSCHYLRQIGHPSAQP